MGIEMALIAYFHRLTSLIFRVLAEIIDPFEGESIDVQAGEEQSRQVQVASGEEDEENEPLLDKQEAVFIGTEDMARMGLDVWSQADRKFVEELVALYWGRRAQVQGARVECCGVRIL